MKIIIMVLVVLFAINAQAKDFNTVRCNTYFSLHKDSKKELAEAIKHKNYFQATSSAENMSEILLNILQYCSKKEGLNIKNVKKDLKIYIELEKKYKALINN